ncbi:Gustatory receptor 162 [Halyomorpha halys]|nr:Gustatory receptor 162 [Halyomorpha halys]
MQTSSTMSTMFQASHVFILTISLLFGVFPLHRIRGTYSFSWKLYVYCLLVAAVTSAYGSWWSYLMLRQHQLSLLLIMDLLVFLLHCTTWVIILLMYYRNRFYMQSVILDLEVIHSRIGATSYVGPYMKGIAVILAAHAFPFLYKLLWNFGDILLKSTILIFLELVYMSAPILLASQYAILLHIVSHQLFTITNQMKTASIHFEFRQILDVNNSLRLLAGRINEAFDVYLFQSVAFCYVITLLRLYAVIVCIVAPNIYANQNMLFDSVVDTLRNCGITILVVSSAVEATNKAEDFNRELFNNIMIRKSLSKENYISTYLATRREIKPNPCNFFTLDFYLLTSMVAGTVTYVTLLVQFTLLK